MINNCIIIKFIFIDDICRPLGEGGGAFPIVGGGVVVSLDSVVGAVTQTDTLVTRTCRDCFDLEQKVINRQGRFLAPRVTSLNGPGRFSAPVACYRAQNTPATAS